jgi:hypothetical protein
MEKQTLKNILNFLEDNEGKKHRYKNTFIWKYMFNEPLTKEDLVFNGDLILENIDISELPEGLYVGGDLNLYYSPIKELPKGLKIGGDLDLYGSKIEQLPEGLKIGRDLNLQYSTMLSLPKGLKVYGDLNIDVSVLSKLSDEQIYEMIEPGFIEGKIHRQ